ncbi:MAG: hypothetical protein LBD85_05600 [Oscillospiraceae bacterium]|jgi:DNA polymerase-3 subunit delta|nr:hypothetical protein [Oscillospiraceae bacterium]
MTTAELKKAIANKTFPPLNLFHGEETYLLNHYLRLARDSIASNDFDVKRLYGADCVYADIAEAINATPFMSDFVFTEVRDFDLFDMSEYDSDSFLNAIEHMPPGCKLVFTYNGDWKPDKRRKLWKSLEKRANIVEFTAQSERDLLPWVIRHFRAVGKQISDNDALYLIRRVGRLMNNLSSEIDKLCAYCEGSIVTAEHIKTLSTPLLEAGVFEMANALNAGNYNASAATLSVLISNREDAIPLVAALSWRFRHDYISALKNPRNPRFEWLSEAILMCAEADVRLKSSSADDAAILSGLYANLAATRRARLGR